MVAIELVKRFSWWQSAFAGVATVFAGIGAGTTYAIFNHCSATFFAAAGLVPVAGEAGLAACIGVTGLWAISAFIAGAAGAGAWKYDSSSSTANSKRHLVNDTIVLNGTSFRMHRDHHVYDEFNSLIAEHSPKFGHKIWNVGKVNNFTSHLDVPSVYTFQAEMPHGNVSVISGYDSIADALQTHERCQQGGNCTSPAAQLAKRDSGDQGWASYSDWGTNQGYDQDYENWNYGYLVPHAYAYGLGEQLINQIQPCTQNQCYGMTNKYCLSLGFSQTRTVDSIAVGQVYMDAFGGVDGECLNG